MICWVSIFLFVFPFFWLLWMDSFAGVGYIKHKSCGFIILFFCFAMNHNLWLYTQYIDFYILYNSYYQQQQKKLVQNQWKIIDRVSSSIITTTMCIDNKWSKQNQKKKNQTVLFIWTSGRLSILGVLAFTYIVHNSFIHLFCFNSKPLISYIIIYKEESAWTLL